MAEHASVNTLRWAMLVGAVTRLEEEVTAQGAPDRLLVGDALGLALSLLRESGAAPLPDTPALDDYLDNGEAP